MTKKNQSFSLAVRADASSVVGTGHVYRCLALCDELPEREDIVFVCRDAPGNLAAMLRSRGYAVRLIPDTDDARADAQATLQALAPFGAFAWLLVDHYGLDAQWENELRPAARRLAVIDDLADRPHACDLLIDSTHRAREAHLYDGLLARSTRRLVGQDHVLLRREFFGSPPPPRALGPVRRLLITLGGTDALGITELALDALDANEFRGIAVDVTLGPSNPRLAHLRARAEARGNVSIYVQHDRMSDLMREADLCFGAGGTTSWERCYMGLPSLVVVLADNQVELAAGLEEAGIARNLGRADRLDVDILRHAFRAAMEDGEWRKTASLKGRRLIDGRGVARVIEALVALS